MEFLIPLFFWGTFITSMFSAAAAIRSRSYKWMIVSAVTYLPFSLYISAGEMFKAYFAVVLAVQLFTIWALATKKIGMSRIGVGLVGVCTVVILFSSGS